MLDRTAPVDVRQPANPADCPGRKQAKRKRNSAAETGEQKPDARTTGTGRWSLRNKVRQPAIKLWQTLDRRAVPAHTLRMSPGAPHRALLPMLPGGGRIHPIRPAGAVQRPKAICKDHWVCPAKKSAGRQTSCACSDSFITSGANLCALGGQNTRHKAASSSTQQPKRPSTHIPEGAQKLPGVR